MSAGRAAACASPQGAGTVTVALSPRGERPPQLPHVPPGVSGRKRGKWIERPVWMRKGGEVASTSLRPGPPSAADAGGKQTEPSKQESPAGSQ